MIYIYDEEQLLNYWCVGFLEVDTGKVFRYEVYKCGDIVVNQLEQFTQFVANCKQRGDTWVGFNNLFYDYPKIHRVIEQSLYYRRTSKDNFLNWNIDDLLQVLYKLSQEIIAEQDSRRRTMSIPVNKHHVKQIDLFKVWHLDNMAKLTSLKQLEINMDLELVEDMPLPYDQEVHIEDIPLISMYNDNDLHATHKFYNITIGNTYLPLYKGQNKLKLREELSEKYGINLTNSNDVAIGKDIITHRIAERLDMEERELRKLRTYRESVPISEVILPHISFNTPLFNGILEKYQKMVVTPEI